MTLPYRHGLVDSVTRPFPLTITVTDAAGFAGTIIIPDERSYAEALDVARLALAGEWDEERTSDDESAPTSAPSSDEPASPEP